MGHFVEAVIANNRREVNEHIERVVDEGYADYCVVIRRFRLDSLDIGKFVSWVERNAPDEDPYELIEEARRQGKRYIYFIDCHH